MIYEQDGVKVSIIDDFDLDNNFCLKLPGVVAHFIPIGKAITISNLIQKAVDQYYSEHPEKIMEQYTEGENVRGS
jgi:hypothetical protein